MLRYLKSQRNIAFLLMLILSFPLTVIAANSTSTPNIVFVVMDNFGYGEMGVYGGGVVRGAPTANIDSVGVEGVQFTNVNFESECTTSRSALMTAWVCMS